MKTTSFTRPGFQKWIKGFLLLASICISQVSPAAVKTTVSSGNWSNPATWSPSGVPAGNDKIKIYHSVTLDLNFTASDTIFVFNVLNFGGKKVLTLNPGTMVLVGTSQYSGRVGTMGKDADIRGNFVFQKWVTRCDGYSTYGSPFNVEATDFNWYYCNRCMPSWSNIYYYDETQPGSVDNGYYDNFSGHIKRGKGFFYWFSNYNGGQNFPRQISLKGASTFTNSFDFGVTRTSSGVSANDGFNLISNPYPGTIDWTSSAWTKTRINNAIYTWNSCSGVYASYVSGIGVNGGSRYIPSMQGFWVQANNNSPLLTVTSAALANQTQSLLRTAGTRENESNVLRLNLGDDEIAIRLDNSSSTKLDSLTDALKMFSDKSTLCSGVRSDSLCFAINSVEEGNQFIPVKVKGSGTLRFTGINTFGNYMIYCKDLVTGILFYVKENTAYPFTDTAVVTFNKRFEIEFRPYAITRVNETEVAADMLIETHDRTFTILPNGFNFPLAVEMCDVLGRRLFQGTFEQSGEISLPRQDQPVIVRISDSEKSIAKKVF